MWLDDYLIYDIVTLTNILITWPWYVYTWYLISDIGTLHVITRHLIFDTWYLTPVLDVLSLDTLYLTPDIWHLIIDMISLTWHAITWNWHIWPDIVTPDWILLHLTPVLHGIFMIITLRGLDMIIILLPDIYEKHLEGGGE